MNSDLLTHLLYLVQNGFRQSSKNIIDEQREPKGQNGGEGTIPAEITDRSRVSYEHEVPNFSSTFRSHTL